jgi:hypothetical protein
MRAILVVCAVGCVAPRSPLSNAEEPAERGRPLEPCEEALIKRGQYGMAFDFDEPGEPGVERWIVEGPKDQITIVDRACTRRLHVLDHELFAGSMFPSLGATKWTETRPGAATRSQLHVRMWHTPAATMFAAWRVGTPVGDRRLRGYAMLLVACTVRRCHGTVLEHIEYVRAPSNDCQRIRDPLEGDAPRIKFRRLDATRVMLEQVYVERDECSGAVTEGVAGGVVFERM